MLRKTHFATSILLLISTALLTCSSAWALSKGFYLGVGAGPQSTDFDQTAHLTEPGTAIVLDKTHLAGTGVFGTLFGGYGWSKNVFYIAGEINGDVNTGEFYSNNKEFIHHSASKTSYKILHSLGISLLPGYLYTENTLFYARLGYANGRFEVSTSDTSLANIRKSLSGIRYGVGVNQTFTQHIAARMEFSRINYRSTQFTVVDGSVTKTTKISPNTSQVEFSLIYGFC